MHLARPRIIFEGKLLFVKSDAKNGFIYRDPVTHHTITFYPSTNTVHVQGTGYSRWTSAFLEIECAEIRQVHNTEPKVIDSVSPSATLSDSHRGNESVQLTEPKSLDIRPVTASTPKPGSVRDLIPNTYVQDLSEVVSSAMNAVDDSEISTLREKLCRLENELIEIRSKLATAVNVEKISVATQTPPAVQVRSVLGLGM